MPKGHSVQQNSFPRVRTSSAPGPRRANLYGADKQTRPLAGLAPQSSVSSLKLTRWRTVWFVSPVLEPPLRPLPPLPRFVVRILSHTSGLIHWDFQALATLKRWSFQASAPRSLAPECHLLLLCSNINKQSSQIGVCWEEPRPWVILRTPSPNPHVLDLGQ